MKPNPIAELAVVTTMPLVANPELITVQTIKPKIVEAMAWLDGPAGSPEKVLDLTGVEAIGRLPEYGILIVRDTQGNLWRMRGHAYVWWLTSQGMSHDTATQVAKSIPQIFAV